MGGAGQTEHWIEWIRKVYFSKYYVVGNFWGICSVEEERSVLDLGISEGGFKDVVHTNG